MAITSSSPAVAARCANVRAGVGVASSQNVTDPRLGPQLLDELQSGADADAALATVAAAAGEHRQLAVVDAQGRSAAWSGARALGVHGTRTGPGWAAAGNLLASEAVLDALGAALRGEPASWKYGSSPPSKPGSTRAARRGRCTPPACSWPTRSPGP